MFEQLRRWRSDRREARMRAPDYAIYLRRMHGAAAEDIVEAKLEIVEAGSYREMLYRLVLRELDRRPAESQAPGYAGAEASR